MQKQLVTAKIDKHSRITIPQEILEKSKIKLNSTVILECLDDNTVCIYPKNEG